MTANSNNRLCVPRKTARLVENHAGFCNTGLLLDKFTLEKGKADQEQQKIALEKVCANRRHDGIDYPSLLQRRDGILGSLEAETWQCRTIGPLTLHLSRASAWENAGICLHPVYGFVYLPGSGLKGMARAYAETIWLAAQPDKREAMEKIESVFGWAPHSNDKKKYLEKDWLPKHGKGDSANAGSIVFHDAWPSKWPRLIVDIVNNHHPDYYQGKDAPPGDWENPKPVYFLAIGAGETFSFALTRRRADADNSLLALAREWLTGALCHMGAGAKTNAGYGSFRPVDEKTTPVPSIETSPAVKTFAATLELVTPAFLAGANQKEDDCDLRPATLRGVLRWWWRTMHAGHMDVRTLRNLEAAIWGDTNTGGALRIEVETITPPIREEYNKSNKIDSFEKPPNKKTTQGLFYVSFGMDDANRKRWLAAPGSKWKIKLLAKIHPPWASKGILPQNILDEAKAALWLLCQYGGVGAKSGKGFGSFEIPDNLRQMKKEECENISTKTRKFLGAEGSSKHESSSLNKILPPMEMRTGWKNSWAALDQLGFSIQAFAKKYKHNLGKQALRLPRRIGAPEKGEFRSEKSNINRHTSPVHFHLAKAEDGTLIIRVVAFPSRYLPDIKTSENFLREFMQHLERDLNDRVAKNKGKWQSAPAASPVATASGKRNSGTPVKVKIIDKREKGGFDVQEAGKSKGTLTVGTPPGSLPNIGEMVDVLIHNDAANNPQYKWKPPAETKKSHPPKGGKGGYKGPPKKRY